MGNMKLVFRALFSLCLFVLTVAGVSGYSTSPNPNPNVAQDPELQVSLVLKRLDALEKRFVEEMSQQFESSQKNCNDQFESLKKELDELRNENSETAAVRLWTPPPLGGRRGKKEKNGDSSGFQDSESMLNCPATPMKTNTSKEIGWEIERPGENWIVAKGISRWDPDGRWGNAQLCPPSTFVTAHKFTYFSNSGLSQVELTCTNKYKTNYGEKDHFLRVTSADLSEVNVIGEEWDIQNRGSRANFAQGFSLNRRVMERRDSARVMSKNYDIVYHDQIPEEFALNSSSSGIVTKCPKNHAICGLIPMMDDAGLGTLSAIGFKCCDVCTPEENWVTVHQFNNTKTSNETVEFNATVGLEQRPHSLNSTNLNLESTFDSPKISPSDFYQEFSAHLSKSIFTGFDWTARNVFVGTEEANLTLKYTCGPKSSCVYQQLVGQCGNVRVPVDKFREGSARIGSSIPESPKDTNRRLSSCRDALEILPSPRSKKQVIYPHGNSMRLEVLCDFKVDGGGWTVIQKRSSGSAQEFNRTWKDYEKGFGSLTKSFWLGLKNIRALTQNWDQELRIELEDFYGNKLYAKYSSFTISDASDFYRLSVGGYSGTAGDSLQYSDSKFVHNGMRFSTYDKDNDKYPTSCAQKYGGGWWYNACHAANLNGKVATEYKMYWVTWNLWEDSFAKSEMKIRKRK